MAGSGSRAGRHQLRRTAGGEWRRPAPAASRNSALRPVRSTRSGAAGRGDQAPLSPGRIPSLGRWFPHHGNRQEDDVGLGPDAALEDDREHEPVDRAHHQRLERSTEPSQSACAAESPDQHGEIFRVDQLGERGRWCAVPADGGAGAAHRRPPPPRQALGAAYPLHCRSRSSRAGTREKRSGGRSCPRGKVLAQAVAVLAVGSARSRAGEQAAVRSWLPGRGTRRSTRCRRPAPRDGRPR